jgi:hypothetical protein
VSSYHSTGARCVSYGGYGAYSLFEKQTFPASSRVRGFSPKFSFKGGTDGYNLVADLSVDSKGGLYGTTRPVPGQCGTVFRLTPPAGKTEWTKTVLYNFDNGVKGCDPEAGVILDSNGALYGTTKSGNSPLTGGTIFKLAPPAAGKTVWTETVLYGFKNGTDGYGPVSELIFDKNGALYGTTTFGSRYSGAVFKLQ